MNHLGVGNNVSSIWLSSASECTGNRTRQPSSVYCMPSGMKGASHHATSSSPLDSRAHSVLALHVYMHASCVAIAYPRKRYMSQGDGQMAIHAQTGSFSPHLNFAQVQRSFIICARSTSVIFFYQTYQMDWTHL